MSRQERGADRDRAVIMVLAGFNFLIWYVGVLGR